MGHKEKQLALADLVRPDLRYGLHVNLIGHGRAVCRAHKPLCETCLLAGECAQRQATLEAVTGRNMLVGAVAPTRSRSPRRTPAKQAPRVMKTA
jgi:adenine-specific DNA glycosylase